MPLTPHTRALIDELPARTCGVYYCYNANDEIIYIGKSLNIRERMRQHFLSPAAKEVKLQRLTHRITYEATGSELIALLRESELIKRHQPLFNRAQRKTRFFYSVYVNTTVEGYWALSLEKINPFIEAIASFTRLADGKDFLFVITERYGLCQKINGLYQTKTSCFQYAIKTCNGACIGKEEVGVYNARVQQFLDHSVLPAVDWWFELPGRTADEKGIVWVEKGNYKGFGFCPLAVTDKKQMQNYIAFKEDNRDIRRILFRYIRKNETDLYVNADCIS